MEHLLPGARVQQLRQFRPKWSGTDHQGHIVSGRTLHLVATQTPTKGTDSSGAPKTYPYKIGHGHDEELVRLHLRLCPGRRADSRDYRNMAGTLAPSEGREVATGDRHHGELREQEFDLALRTSGVLPMPPRRHPRRTRIRISPWAITRTDSCGNQGPSRGTSTARSSTPTREGGSESVDVLPRQLGDQWAGKFGEFVQHSIREDLQIVLRVGRTVARSDS